MVVFARLANPNLLPKNEPLRPPAENVLPNYSNNINVTQEPGDSSSSLETGNAGQEIFEPNPASTKNAEKDRPGGLPGASKVPVLIAIVSGVVLVISGIYFVLKKRQSVGKSNDIERG